MDKTISKIVEELAKEHNMPKFKMELIIMSQFKTIRDVIKQGDLESIGIMHLGTFYINNNRKNKIIEARNAKRDKNIE